MALEPAAGPGKRRLPAKTAPRRADPGLIRATLGVYRGLIRAYPAEFGAEYGRWMEQALRDRCLAAFRQHGPAGLPRVWADTTLDWIKTVIDQHSRRGIHMKSDLLIRACGISMILGGAALALALIASTLYSGTTDPRNFIYRPIDPLLYILQQATIPAFMLLMAVGMLGVFLRFGAAAGPLGALAAILGGIGGAAAFGFSLVMILAGEREVPGAWNTMMLGVLAMFAGLAVFGAAAHLRRLPSGVGPAALGTGILALTIAAVSVYSKGDGPGPIWMLVIPISVGLAAVGRALASQPGAAA